MVPAGLTRTVRLEGELDALRRDDQFVWSAIKLECRDEKHTPIAVLDMTKQEDTYLLPAGTKYIKLNIGDDLGGGAWWSDYDSEEPGVDADTIVLRVTKQGGDSGPGPAPQPTRPEVVK